jgi:predicted transcriptional regulator
MSGTEIIKFGTALPEHLHTKLKSQASVERRAMQDILAQLVEEYLDRIKKGGKQERERPLTEDQKKLLEWFEHPGDIQYSLRDHIALLLDIKVPKSR